MHTWSNQYRSDNEHREKYCPCSCQPLPHFDARLLPDTNGVMELYRAPSEQLKFPEHRTSTHHTATRYDALPDCPPPHSARRLAPGPPSQSSLYICSQS